MLGVSRSWLYQAANSGRIPCVRLGGPDGPVRFRLTELWDWIEEGRIVQAGGEDFRRDGIPAATTDRIGKPGPLPAQDVA